jgi:hypothetical protein
MQNVKFIMAKNSNCIYPQSSPTDDMIRPNVYKFNNSIVFEYLLTPHIPFELDYVEVLSSLCDSLAKLYEKFLHDDCYRLLFVVLLFLLFY